MKLKHFAAFRAAPAQGMAVRKDFELRVREVDQEARTLEFVISTEAVDRYGDSVKLEGWQWESYLRNPVVLYCHDYQSLPVGKALEVRAEGKSLVATIQFAPAELNPLAEAVYRMVLDGYLSAVSVGFVPLKWAWVEDKEAGRLGYDVLAAELLEISVVPVPANAEALVQGRAARADGAAGKEAASPQAVQTEAEQEPEGESPDTPAARAGLKLRRARVALLRLLA